MSDAEPADEAAAAGHHRYRSVSRITSPDLTTWSSTRIVLETDRADLAIPTPLPPAEPEGPLPRPTLDFYTSNAAPYAWAADVYLMMPTVYYHWRGDYPATMDVCRPQCRAAGTLGRRAGIAVGVNVMKRNGMPPEASRSRALTRMFAAGV